MQSSLPTDPAALIAAHPGLFLGFAAVFGAIVGSFLNVVIYRLPRGLSVNKPRRSFCPSCEKSIPWYLNIPVLSWVAIGGRCLFCKNPISARYPGVELFTAAMFALAWWHSRGDFGLALALWCCLSLLIAATFIDLDFMIIPDSITLGGAAAGLVFSVAIPALHGTSSRIEAAGYALMGGVLGYLVVWGVVEAGKLAFGKTRLTADPAEEFSLALSSEQKKITVGEDSLIMEEVLARRSDRLVVTCTELFVNGRSEAAGEARFSWEGLELSGKKIAWEALRECHGKTSAMVIPREAMGFGDVKFMAMIGAFLGWKGALFSLVIGSVIGAFIGGALMLLRRKQGGSAVPFGPFLAVGAALWIFIGPSLLEWYLSLLRPDLHGGFQL